MPTKIISAVVLAFCVLFAAPASNAKPKNVPNEAHAKDGIAWFAGSADAAFAQAKREGKPVFVYWGAVWCPPCNQVKATIFNRQAFIERSRDFIALHVDGDSRDGQKLGARFKVTGYPTMLLLRPDGTEVTRLPGEVDVQRYLQVLELGMSATRPVNDLISAAIAGKDLSASEWRLLSLHAWVAQSATGGDQPAFQLQQLAAKCPPGAACTRLGLLALAMTASAKPGDAPAVDQAAGRALLHTALADARLQHDNFDIFVNYLADVCEAVTDKGSAARRELGAEAARAMRNLLQDDSISRIDRAIALNSLVALARLEQGEGVLNDALLLEVRGKADELNRATHDPYERHAVIDALSETLGNAGLLDDSDAMLKAELKRSHVPYYLMLVLASNAKKRGDTATAVDWYEKAWHAARGPATRLQWGATYLSGLLELAPQDEARVELTAGSILKEAGASRDAFYDRSLRSLERIATRLAVWGKDGHDDALQRISQGYAPLCAHLPVDSSERKSCLAAFKI